MRINVDRLCELAGVSGSRRTHSGLIRESANYGEQEEYSHMDESQMDSNLADALAEEAEDEKGDKDDDPENEVVEINEADLVKELRRMKVKMHEQRKIQKRRQQNLQEAQLKSIIDQEVKNVLKELNLNSGWMYGKRKPTQSKRGYTHQGSFLKGFGFK